MKFLEIRDNMGGNQALLETMRMDVHKLPSVGRYQDYNSEGNNVGQFRRNYSRHKERVNQAMYGSRTCKRTGLVVMIDYQCPEVGLQNRNVDQSSQNLHHPSDRPFQKPYALILGGCAITR